jgi:hypothetical protein
MGHYLTSELASNISHNDTASHDTEEKRTTTKTKITVRKRKPFPAPRSQHQGVWSATVGLELWEWSLFLQPKQKAFNRLDPFFSYLYVRALQLDAHKVLYHLSVCRAAADASSWTIN